LPEALRKVKADLALLAPVSLAVPPLSALSADDLALRSQLMKLLDDHHGNVTAVARDLGKARLQVYRCIRRFDLGAYRGRFGRTAREP